MAKHENNGKCLKCAEFLLEANTALRTWFEVEQTLDPELHTSCSYRDSKAQEMAKEAGSNKASYGKSPHNYKPAAALDLFFIIKGQAAWVLSKYKKIADRLPVSIEWGGSWKSFKDSPHFELKGWKSLVKNYPKGD